MMHIIPKDDPKQTLRIKRFLMAFGTYIIWMLIALFCYYDGLFARIALADLLDFFPHHNDEPYHFLLYPLRVE